MGIVVGGEMRIVLDGAELLSEVDEDNALVAVDGPALDVEAIVAVPKALLSELPASRPKVCADTL